MDTRLFKYFDATRFSLNRESELFYSSVNRTAQVVKKEYAQILQRCNSFSTLGDHANRLASALSVSSEKIREVLNEFVESGLLISKDMIMEKIRPSRDKQNSPNRLSTIGIPTNNRVRALERAVLSYFSCCKRFGRQVKFIVSDDSKEEAVRCQNLRMLVSLKEKYAIEIGYIGPSERQAMIRSLVRKANVPNEVVEFAILNPAECPLTIGGARNVLLLCNTGELFVSVDDDTVCQMGVVPDSRAALKLTSAFDPSEFWFFPDSNSAVESTCFVEEDFLGAHENLLGKDSCTWLSGFPDDFELDLNEMSSSFAVRLLRFGGRVRATSLGVVGDSGLGPASWHLFLSGNSHNRLTESEAFYQCSLLTRHVLSGVRCTTISEGTGCMALNLGVDCRDLVPPFMPVQRGEDAVFAHALRICFPNEFMGFLPFVLLHLPPEERRINEADLWRDISTVTSNQMLVALMSSFARGSAPPNSSELMRRLGSYLSELSEMGQADFREFVRLIILQIKAQRLSSMMGLLKLYQCQPEFWARNIERAMLTLRKALPSPGFVSPRDLAGPFGSDRALIVFQDLVSRFGKLLTVWPKLFDGAREMQACGEYIRRL